MWLCYAIAAIPVVLGAFFWLHTRRITFAEWMVGSLLGIAVAVGFHVYAIVTLTLDARIASGPVAFLTHYPKYPDTEWETGWHDHWAVTLDLGDGRADFEITAEEAESIRMRLGAPAPEKIPSETYDPSREEYRVELYRNRTGVQIPGWTIVSARRNEGGPDVFSFADPPEGLPLYDYPFVVGDAAVVGLISDLGGGTHVRALEVQDFDWRESRRLLGRAAEDLSIAQWDAVNAELGPKSGVNLIAIGFEGDASLARWQEASWKGGKRNDLVICYGPVGESGKPAWTYCFGWTGDETVKRSLESLFLTRGVSDSVLPEMRETVASLYRPREWPEVGWFSIRPPRGAIAVLILLTLILQGRYWIGALLNYRQRAAASEAEVAEEREEERRITERSMLDNVRQHLPPPVPPSDAPLTAAEMVRALFAKDHDARVTALDWLNGNAPRPAECEEAREAVPWLIEKLEDRDAEQRAEALRLLDLIDPGWRDRLEAKRGIPHLLSRLRTRQPGPADFDALGARGALVRDDLAEMAEETGKVTEIHGLKALGHTGDIRAVPRLLAGLDAEKDMVRRFALSGLANFGPGLRDAPEADRLLERLLPLLGSVEQGDRLNAVRALGGLGRAEAVPELAPLLANPDRAMRYHAAEALGRIGGASAVEALLEGLHEAERNDLPFRIAALARTRDARIVKPLLELQKTDAGRAFPATEAIIEALYRLDGEEIDRLLDRQADGMRGAAPYLADRRRHQRKTNRHAWS